MARESTRRVPNFTPPHERSGPTDETESDQRVAAIRDFYDRFTIRSDVAAEVGGTGRVPNEGGAIPLLAPYTVSAPIDGFTFDSLTGVASFTPVVQGNFIFGVDVLEWDENDSLLSRTVRDFQIQCDWNSRRFILL